MYKTYTTHEAMKVLGISRPTFSRWTKKYDLKPVTLGSGRGHQSVWNGKHIDRLAAAKILKVTAK